MTKDEHVSEAERLLRNANKLAERPFGLGTSPALRMQSIQILLAEAQLHATLALVQQGE